MSRLPTVLLCLLSPLCGCSPTRPSPAQPLVDGKLALAAHQPSTTMQPSVTADPQCTVHGEPKAIVGAPPGQFDFYVFTLSWEPQFCLNNRNAQGCNSHSRFIVHGLWPQDADGTLSGLLRQSSRTRQL